MNSRYPRPALALTVVIFLGLAYYYDISQHLNLASISAAQQELRLYGQAHPLLLGGGFFLVYVTATALSIPGATFLTLLGGALFGFWYGLLIVSFASTIGATLAFLLARFLLRDWVQKTYGKHLTALNTGFEQEGSFYLFAMRLLPVFPFFLVNILTALTSIRIRTFYWASQVGMLPGTAVYVYAGTELGQIKSLSDVTSPSLIAAFVMLGLFPLIAKKAISTIRRRRAPHGQV